MRSQSLGRLLGTNIAKHGFTHALRIPFATPTSRPQLKNALQRIMSDPTASHVHPLAFARPDTLDLNLGSLSLQTPESMDKAVRLLKTLDLDGMLRECMPNRLAVSVDPTMSAPITMEPLCVSLSGISPNEALQKRHRCSRLYVPVVGDTEFLSAFLANVSKRFLSAGVMHLDELQRGETPLHTKLIHNKSLRKKKLNTKPSIVLKSEGRPVNRLADYDVRDLYDKFKTLDFTSSFALERLCTTGIDTKNIVKDGRVIGRGFEEVASVPLPGIDRLEEQIELKDVTYVNTGVIFV